MRAEIKDGVLHIWIPLKLTAGPIDEEILAVHFTPKEMQVLDGIVAAKTNKEIATDMCISERVVKWHIYNLFQKTDCASRMQLAQRFAGRRNAELVSKKE